MQPEYIGMPPTDRVYEVGKLGQIRCGGKCKDDYARIVILHQDPTHYLKLQQAAADSIKIVQNGLSSTFPQHPFVFCTGNGWRACADQAALYAEDSKRYAAPSTTAHCRGLAIDVDQNQDAIKLHMIHRLLSERHWFQTRTDEPWHYSFGISV